MPRSLSAPRIRLVCLPHAGSGASTYFAWQKALAPGGTEVRAVQYPGRENRFGEALIKNAKEMVSALADQWDSLAGQRPCVLYGHSMGALLAFELTIELARRQKQLPLRLFLGGSNPPHLPRTLPNWHGLSDSELLSTVARHYGSLPAELLANDELCALLAPILRADFMLLESYRCRAGSCISVPLTILAGTDDPFTTSGELAEWRLYSTQESRIHWIQGGHLFHQTAPKQVLAVVQATLDRDLLGSNALRPFT
ncbi:MAG: thioesterase II family protein [Gammaproteobacteria bacterium]